MNNEGQGQFELGDWQSVLRWYANMHGWIAKTEKTVIFVSEETYERAIQAYFTERGLTRTTYSQIMAMAESVWEHQCSVERDFQQNIGQWASSRKMGVKVYCVEREEQKHVCD